MVTHCEEYVVRTAVVVPMLDGKTGTWQPCPELPHILGEDTVRSCADLRVILESQAGVVSRLLRTIAKYSGFRLLARESRTHGLVGSVEWVRHECGLWHQWDAPLTSCDYGQHRPAALLAA